MTIDVWSECDDFDDLWDDDIQALEAGKTVVYTTPKTPKKKRKAKMPVKKTKSKLVALACPFCGNEPRIREVSTSFSRPAIWCEVCAIGFSRSRLSDVVKKWNTRATPQVSKPTAASKAAAFVPELDLIQDRYV